MSVQFANVLCSLQYERIELDLLAQLQRKTKLSKTVNQRVRIVDLVALELHLHLLVADQVAILKKFGQRVDVRGDDEMRFWILFDQIVDIGGEDREAVFEVGAFAELIYDDQRIVGYLADDAGQSTQIVGESRQAGGHRLDRLDFCQYFVKQRNVASVGRHETAQVGHVDNQAALFQVDRFAAVVCTGDDLDRLRVFAAVIVGHEGRLFQRMAAILDVDQVIIVERGPYKVVKFGDLCESQEAGLEE